MGAMQAEAFGEDGMRPRATWRLTCSVLVDMRTDGTTPHRIRVCDLSEAGFMAEHDGYVPIGSTVSLDLPGVGLVHARIRWSLAGRIGGRFMKPVDFATARDGIARATSTV